MKNSARFAGQTVWITGASSGIGEACARAFADEGAQLILSARRRSELERVASGCVRPGVSAPRVECMDLDDTESLAGVVARVLTNHPNIDVMVHNAGLSQRSRAIETAIDVDERLMRVNYLGPVALTKALLPSMVARRRGHFVVVTSLVGVFGTPMRSSYSASKHALHGFFDSLRAEHTEDQLKVTVVCPGFVQTDVSRNALTGDGSPQGSMDPGTAKGITADTCAARMLDAIAQGRQEVYVGGAERFAVYVKRYVPRVFSALIARAKVT
ncbi:MAG: SDR family oxidoreductase [Deltaproteobacteria bacterium]|nr:SDR family oxidoreductase [Deltaproteobacteria bacterium]